MDTYGRLDCAINNAGISMHPTILHEIEDSMMDHVIGVNLKSIFYCMKYEIIEMLKTGGGAIVNMSSVGGLLGTPGQSMYNTTKHGIWGMTKAAAVEYAKKGLQINAICPGAVKTAIWEASGLLEKIEANIPAGKAAEAQDIANIALFLCSGTVDPIFAETGYSTIPIIALAMIIVHIVSPFITKAVVKKWGDSKNVPLKCS